jgi:hypothetical protein
MVRPGRGYRSGMTTTLPAARGPITTAVLGALTEDRPVSEDALAAEVRSLGRDLLTDDDFQLALWISYAVHYVPLAGVPDDREWDPAHLGIRRVLEQPFLEALRGVTADLVRSSRTFGGDLPERIFVMADDFDGPALAAYLQRSSTAEQFREFLIHRSAYNVRESDPQAFALPRLTGGPKTAMAELLYDEFGAGRAEREHGSLFAASMVAAGLDPTYGAHVDLLPGSTLAQTNAMNLFNLHRRHLPAAVGHFAAFEATSSEPSRKLASGAQRLGLPAAVGAYFEEHVGADAVHEQLMARSVCAEMVATDPASEGAVLFGAATCLVLDAVANAPLLEAFKRGESSLLPAEDARLAS